MASTIQLKNSATPYKVPTNGDLTAGEMAVNTNDGKVYIKMTHDNGGTPEDHIIDVTGNQHNGFEPDYLGRRQSTISFVEGTRTFTIDVKSPYTFYHVYFSGRLYKKTAPESVVIPDTEGNHYIYFDEHGVLLSSTTIPSFVDMIFVCYLYWDATNKKAVILGDERHSSAVDETLHTYLHRTFGTRYDSGFAISGYTLNTDSDAGATFGISNGTIWDEDLRHDIVATATPTNFFEQDLADPAKLPVLYRDGAAGGWRTSTAASLHYLTAGTGRVAFNLDTAGTWSQSEAGNGNFVAYFVMATNDIRTPVVILQGQRQDTSLVNAQQNALWTAINWGTFAFQESKVLYRVIVQTANAYAGTQKARIAFVEDLRSSQLGGSSAVTGSDHGGLSGLADPDHPALAIFTNTTNFTGLLSVANDTVQSALDTLDDHNHARITTPAYAGTMSVNADGFDVIRVSLTGNVTAFDLTGGIDGRRYILEFVQDAVGGRTVVFGSSIRFGTDITSVTLSTGVNKIDRIGIIYNLAANKYDVVAVVKGF